MEGLREGLLEAIALGLKLRFGIEALHFFASLEEIRGVERLRGLKEALTEVRSVEEFAALLARAE